MVAGSRSLWSFFSPDFRCVRLKICLFRVADAGGSCTGSCSRSTCDLVLVHRVISLLNFLLACGVCSLCYLMIVVDGWSWFPPGSCVFQEFIWIWCLYYCVFTTRIVVYLRILVYVAEPHCSFPYTYSLEPGGMHTGCCRGWFPYIFLLVSFSVRW